MRPGCFVDTAQRPIPSRFVPSTFDAEDSSGRTIRPSERWEISQAGFAIPTTPTPRFDALVDTYVHWVSATDVDGFRLDAVPHMSHEFWRRFCPAVRARLAELGKANFLLLGEVFDGDRDRVSSYTTDGQLDAAFDFPAKLALIDGVLLEGAPASTARRVLAADGSVEVTAGHPDGIGIAPWDARVLFADNHDTARIASALEDARIPVLAMTLVFTVGGLPSVYYGTEQQFRGTGQDSSRERLWLSGFREDGLMFRLIARLASLRRAHVALRRGKTIVRFASAADVRDETATDAGLFIFERVHDEGSVLIAVNANAEREATARIETAFSPGTRLHEVLWGDGPSHDVDGKRARAFLPPARRGVLAWRRAAA